MSEKSVNSSNESISKNNTKLKTINNKEEKTASKWSMLSKGAKIGIIGGTVSVVGLGLGLGYYGLTLGNESTPIVIHDGIYEDKYIIDIGKYKGRIIDDELNNDSILLETKGKVAYSETAIVDYPTLEDVESNNFGEFYGMLNSSLKYPGENNFEASWLTYRGSLEFVEKWNGETKYSREEHDYTEFVTINEETGYKYRVIYTDKLIVDRIWHLKSTTGGINLWMDLEVNEMIYITEYDDEGKWCAEHAYIDAEKALLTEEDKGDVEGQKYDYLKLDENSARFPFESYGNHGGNFAFIYSFLGAKNSVNRGWYVYGLNPWYALTEGNEDKFNEKINDILDDNTIKEIKNIKEENISN